MIILVVEDQPKQADFIKKALEQDMYTVELALDGQDAWEKIQVRDYDLLVLDLDLPKMPGTELIQKTRELGITTPVLVLTANDHNSVKVANLNIGADDYLTKPFGLEEFLARVKALLRRPKEVLPQSYKIGDLEIFYGTHEVQILGRAIKLTRNEFRVLDFLMRRPDRVCTRAMIQEHVWGYESDPQSNVIEAVVYSLRKKLGEQYKNVIETVQNIGYRIRKPAT